MKKLRVDGYNLDRFLDQVLSSGILPEKLKRPSHNELEIQLSDKDYEKLVVKKNISCYNISVISSKPHHSILLTLLKRSGVFVGLIIAMFVMAILTSNIWSIDINVQGADSEAIKQEAEQILKDNGVEVGCPLGISYKEIQDKLLSRIEESSAVVVKRNGAELIIDITLRVSKSELEQSDIVSAFDGLITDIDYTSGILAVNIGEGVTKGQILIASGYVGDYFAEANGEIKAKVLISGEAVGSILTEKTTRTGNIKIIEAFEVFGKTYYFDFDGNFQNLFSNYEIEKEEVNIAENIAFPIKHVRYIVYELGFEQITISKESLIGELKVKAYNVAKSKLPSEAEEMNVTYNIFNEGTLFKAVCNIETEISIGERTK